MHPNGSNGATEIEPGGSDSAMEYGPLLKMDTVFMLFMVTRDLSELPLL